VQSLDAHYGDFQALFGVTVELGEGELVSIVGPNGAGKSTLLKSIAGVLPARQDAITFDGEAIGGLGTMAATKRGIFLVPEGRMIFPSLTVEENLLIGSHTRREGPWGLQSVYELFPALVGRKGVGGSLLSGGEQQMLAIGRGLVANPRLLLLDEISLGLAPIVIKDLYSAIPRIRERGTTLILVEQDVRQAASVADRLICMQGGKVVLESAPGAVSHEELVNAYFGLES
jgi:branched-chain amino acid transport system ATP-binding protein